MRKHNASGPGYCMSGGIKMYCSYSKASKHLCSKSPTKGQGDPVVVAQTGSHNELIINACFCGLNMYYKASETPSVYVINKKKLI